VTLKRALIVDDSKSARVILSRLLEKHDLAVETRESAEGALEYLEQNRPDVIFMDHVMSGMDGLSALQLIKKDPLIASIPVLMYTSQDGVVYADAAKASGADGVLPKQMATSDITDALIKFKVIPARPASVIAADRTEAAHAAVALMPALGPTDVRQIVEPLLRDQGSELRRYIGHEFEALATKLSADMARRIESAAADIVHRLAPPPPAPPPRPWALIGGLFAACAVMAVFGVCLLRYQGEVVGLRATIDRQSVALATSSASVSSVTTDPWPGERHPLGFGEAPFTPARIAQLSNWLGTLEQHGFVGTARIVVSLSDYCLTGNPGEGFSIAPVELPISACDLRGSPPDDMRPTAEREPTAVKTLLAALDARTHGEIRAEVVYAKASGYPPLGGTAGQWNAAAAQGHILEFIAQARTH